MRQEQVENRSQNSGRWTETVSECRLRSVCKHSLAKWFLNLKRLNTAQVMCASPTADSVLNPGVTHRASGLHVRKL